MYGCHCHTECGLVWAVHVGIVQGAVTHVVYWLRPVPATEHNRRLADHGQHADRCHVLRNVCRSCHHAHPVLRHFQKTLPRKGMSATCCSTSYMSKWFPQYLRLFLSFNDMHSATYDILLCPTVCPSGGLSRSCIVWKRLKLCPRTFSASGSPSMNVAVGHCCNMHSAMNMQTSKR